MTISPEIVKNFDLITSFEVKSLSRRKTIEWTEAISKTDPLTLTNKKILFDVTLDEKMWFFLSLALVNLNQLLLRSLKITVPLPKMDILSVLLRKAHFLELLKVESGFFEDGNDIVKTVSQWCPYLKRLSLPGKISQKALDLSPLSHCSHLHELEVPNNAEILEKGVIELLEKAGKQFTYLNFYGCPQLTEATLDAIASFCPHLEVLNIGGGVTIEATSLLHLSEKTSQLKKLYLEGMDFCEIDLDKLGKLFSQLEELSLTTCILSHEFFKKIGVHLGKVRRVILSECLFLSLEDLESLLSSANHLEFLEGIGCSFSKKEVAYLESQFSQTRFVFVD